MGDWKLISVLVCVFFLTVFFTTTASSENLELGDLNNDGVVNVFDMIVYLEITPLGDTNEDYLIDIYDLAGVGKAFYSREGDADYDPGADVNMDKFINIIDLARVGKNYGMKAFETGLSKNTSYITVEPPYTEVSEGGNFTIDVDIDTDDEVFAASLYLFFDPGVLEVTDAEEGDFLKKDGNATFPQIRINNTGGYVDFGNTRFGLNISGVSGSGTLVSVNFTAKSTGTSELELVNVTLLDRNLLELPSVYTTDGDVDVVEMCTNGETRPCPLQEGVCKDSYETCTNNSWPGCNESSYGLDYEDPETTCDGLDNDCDNQTDEGGDSLCDDGLWCNGQETCGGANGCQAGTAVDCSDNLFCTVNERCDEISDACLYDDRDCSSNDVSGIATCDNDPDSNPYTWDYREAFTSSCDETEDVCTNGEIGITHTCDKVQCGAECEQNSDCDDSDPYTVDTCLGDCTCDHEVLECLTDGDCDHLDSDYCEGDLLRHDEGYCDNGSCLTNKTTTQDCYYTDSYCYENDIWLETGFCNASTVQCGYTQDISLDCSYLDNDYCMGSVVFNEYGQCVDVPQTMCITVGGGYDCNNQKWCDGEETCSEEGGVHCENGSAPDCDDGVGCTDDSCDEENDVCVNTANDGNCDDGLWCNGFETCDAVNDCQAGTAVDCSDNLFCTVNERCDEISDACVYDDRDCSPNDLSGIATCDNDPDSNPYTWDYREAFTSVCDEIEDVCTQGEIGITHTCDKVQCGAECESGGDCAATDCDNLDGCHDGTYRDYDDVSNDCKSDCSCENNACSDYTELITDNDNDGYDTECDDDCNDNNASIHPGAAEVCNGVDDDCDGQTDEGFPDLDNDGLADCIDPDDDGDEVNDTEDNIAGDSNDVNTNLDNFSFSVDGNTDPNTYSGVGDVELKEGDSTIVEFSYNFSEDDLYLPNITVDKQSNDSITGSMIIQGIDLGEGNTKSVYVDRISGTGYVCVKDREMASIDEISSSCNEADEYEIACPGTNGSYTCSIAGNKYRVDGLRYSGVKEDVVCVDNDGDGYGDPASDECAHPELDCNDNSASINPGATEICNGVDDDCDGQTDEGGDSLCDDGLWCNGQETCGGANGCQAGTAPDCSDGKECTGDVCDEENDECDNPNLDAGTLCGLARDCPEDGCNGYFAEFYPPDGHDSCDGNGNCLVYSCAMINSYCTDNDPYDLVNTFECGAPCDQNSDCNPYCVGDFRYYSGICSGECACSYSTEDCNDYDTDNCWCTTGATLSEVCDDWTCSGGECGDSGSDWTANSWSCNGNVECSQQDCQGTDYICYRTNGGSWNWASSAESTESNCNDGYDNDCDGLTDALDPDCPAPDLRITVANVYPSTPEAGGYLVIEFRIKNAGDQSTNEVYWEIDTDSSDPNPKTSYPDSTSLNAGEGKNVSVKFRYAEAGFYNAGIIADPDDVVEENNEGNNVLYINVTVINPDRETEDTEDPTPDHEDPIEV